MSRVVSTGGAVVRTPQRALLGIVLLGVGLPLGIAAYTGSLSIPHNDAWAYSRIAQHFGETGHIRLLGWTRTSLIGQVFVLGPVGRSIVAQQVFVAFLAALGLVATYVLLASRVGWRRATFGTAIVACWPGFGLLATSFMTDIPAYTATVACLAVGTRALSARSPSLVAGAVAIGVWGATIREQVAVAPVAVLVAAYVMWRREGKTAVLLGIAGACLTGLAAFELWRQGLPAGRAPDLGISSGTVHEAARISIRGYFTLALVVSPAVVLSARPSSWSRMQVIGTAGGAIIAAYALVHLRDGLLLGNYLDRHGVYTAVGFGTRDPLPLSIWRGLTVLACVSGMLLVGLIAAYARRIDLLLGVFALLTVVSTVGQVAFGQLLFDRYLLLLLPPALAVSLVAPMPRPRLGAAIAVPTITALGLVSLALSANGLAFDAARWKAGQQLADDGVRPTKIDAGFEWVGYHSPVPVTAHTPARGVAWYSRLFPKSSQCYVVSAVPAVKLVREHEPGEDALDDGALRRRGAAVVAGWQVKRTVRYHTFGMAGMSRLWVYALRCP